MLTYAGNVFIYLCILILSQLDRIPNVLHRIIFLGSMPLISEKELMELMDTTMLRAYEGWKDANQQSGFRFELYNLERAEAYIKEHFQEQVYQFTCFSRTKVRIRTPEELYLCAGTDGLSDFAAKRLQVGHVPLFTVIPARRLVRQL